MGKCIISERSKDSIDLSYIENNAVIFPQGNELSDIVEEVKKTLANDDIIQRYSDNAIKFYNLIDTQRDQQLINALKELQLNL